MSADLRHVTAAIIGCVGIMTTVFSTQRVAIAVATLPLFGTQPRYAVPTALRRNKRIGHKVQLKLGLGMLSGLLLLA